jgi:hypothetical protein
MLKTKLHLWSRLPGRQQQQMFEDGFIRQIRQKYNAGSEVIKTDGCLCQGLRGTFASVLNTHQVTNSKQETFPNYPIGVGLYRFTSVATMKY